MISEEEAIKGLLWLGGLLYIGLLLFGTMSDEDDNKDSKFNSPYSDIVYGPDGSTDDE